MEILICRRFKFDAAHYLPFHEGKCQRVHGHRWYIDVSILGTVNSKSKDPENGMVMDFNDLKKIVEGKILSWIDHFCINDQIPGIEMPTAENLAKYFGNLLESIFEDRYRFGKEKEKEKVELYSIKVWESEDSFAEYRPKGFGK